ncbi:MAG: hypothetical protein R3B09_09995 [Nannocystaceae bacterium]
MLAAFGSSDEGERLDRDACAWGYAPSCLRRADALAGHDADAERVKLLHYACDAGLLRGCSELLREEMRNTGVTAERLREGCELQDASLCTAYAREMAARGQLDLARAFDERACDLGYADGCDAVGLSGGVESITDESGLLQRKSWLIRACLLRGMRGPQPCERAEELEREYSLSTRLPGCRSGLLEKCPPAVAALAKHDPQAASGLVGEVLKQAGDACRRSSEACRAIQFIHEDTGCGEFGVERCLADSAALRRQQGKSGALRAHEKRLLRAECHGGNALSCEFLASWTPDPKEAERIYMRACDLGSATSCSQALTSRADYRYVDQGEEIKYHEMACSAGDHAACLRAAGYWSADDPRSSELLRERARELVLRGCSSDPYPGAWCSSESILSSLLELKMGAYIVDVLRNECHGRGDTSSCELLVDALVIPTSPWS